MYMARIWANETEAIAVSVKFLQKPRSNIATDNEQMMATAMNRMFEKHPLPHQVEWLAHLDPKLKILLLS